MLDEALSLPSKHFRFSEKISFLSFSKVLHDFLTLSGCESTHVQYWPKDEGRDYSRNQELSVFFWERTPEHVREYDVSNWFRNYECNLYFRNHRDPGHLAGTSPTQTVENRIIRLSGDWLDRSEYLKILSAASVFVAPRRYEGIGLSMLEALVRGIPVVGLDSPTLNEYVINGENGVLIQDKFKSLDVFDFSKMSTQALEMSIQGHKAYELQISEFLYNFLEGEQRPRRRFAIVPERLTLRQYLYVVSGR
jgi:glycosyltransferase involved in cell wall biosynthesis